MEQFRCPVCQAEFSTNDQLDRHMRQHDEQSTRVTRSAPPSLSDERKRDEERKGGSRAASRSPADLPDHDRRS